MPPHARKRLAPEVFDLPVEKMRAGWYTDAYFNHARSTLLADGRHPHVVVQVFQKNDAWLGGVDEAIAILKLCSHAPDGLTIRALYDGSSEAGIATEVTLEDGRKGVLSARIIVRDMETSPAPRAVVHA